MERKMQIVKNVTYLCKAERTVRAKTYASALDLRLNAPSRGIQSCRTEQPGLYMSSMSAVSTKTVCFCSMCLVMQYGFSDMCLLIQYGF